MKRKKTLVSKILSGLQGRNADKQQETKFQQGERQKLKLVFFIVDLNKAKIVTNVLIEEKVRFHFTCTGRGTANSEVLDLLGIGSTEKAVVTCLEQTVGVKVLMKEARKKLRTGTGAGIAFSIPLSAINDPVLLVFKQSIMNNENIAGQSGEEDFGEGVNMSDKITHDLIICVVNHGSSDELMDTARAAGAKGGTVINARGTAHEGAVKFFGISIQDEKEMILILTGKDKKTAIMQAICEKHGLNKEAQGIVFSLPVDDVMGLSLE